MRDVRQLVIRVLLPRDRHKVGWLRVEREGEVLFEVPVLGRGKRGRGVFATSGDTPTGSYGGEVFQDTSSWNQRSYGPWGAVRLRPMGGDAILAEAFGRDGLLIHGGASRASGRLRPTYGCLRVSNEDMKRIRGVVLGGRRDDESLMSVDLSVLVVVEEFL